MEKADQLTSQESFVEEIKLRKSILRNITDTNSDDYKTQTYKLNLAEFNNSRDPKIVLKKIKEAEKIFNTLKIQDPITKIKIGINHSEALAAMGDEEEAINKLLELHEFSLQQPTNLEAEMALSNILIHLGKNYLSIHEYDKSIEYFKQALEKNKEIYGYNSLETGLVFKELAVTYSYTGNFQEGLTMGDKALEIFESIPSKDLFVLFRQYADNYQGYRYYGDVDKTKSLYSKMTNYYNENKHESSFLNLEHSNYPNLNPVNATYYFVQLQEASTSSDLEKAEEVFLKFKNELPKQSVKYHNNEMNLIHSYYCEIAFMFHRQDNYENIDNYKKAKRYYLDALKFNQANGFEFGEFQVYLFLNYLAVDYSQWEDVVSYTQMALDKPGIENFNHYRSLKHSLGLAYGEMKDYEKAFEILDEEYDNFLNDDTGHYYPIADLIESGNLYLTIYEESPKTEYLEKAYRNFHLSSVIFSRFYRGGQFSSRLHWFLSRINNGMLLSAIKLGKYQKEVVEQVEKNHSDHLWSSFVKNRKEPFNKTLMQLQSKLDSLKIRQILLASQINNDSIEPENISRLRLELKSTEKTYDKIDDDLKMADNSFYQFSRSDFDMDKIRERISKDEVVIKYIVTDFSAFAYTIEQKGINLIQLKNSGPELKEKVTTYLTDLKSANNKFGALSGTLYSDLIDPLLVSKNKKLVIVPDGFLSNLPFETLLSSEGKYLIEDHTISYAYSLKLFDIQNSFKDSSNSLLAVFSPQYNLQYANDSEIEDLQTLVRSGNYELLGATEEAKYVNTIFGGDLYLGEQATKTNFLEKSSQYDILHLAMHAIVNEEDSNMSSLIFNNDERLYLSELYDMKIPAHLAVLSACDTGYGEIKDGEGVQSLSRAFTYAGVKSTVMSLWPVPDRETSVIMTQFYTNLKDGKSKDEALQLAKVNYMKNVSEVELKHPYY